MHHELYQSEVLGEAAFLSGLKPQGLQHWLSTVNLASNGEL
jgi:hypothetical protein